MNADTLDPCYLFDLKSEIALIRDNLSRLHIVMLGYIEYFVVMCTFVVAYAVRRKKT